MYMYIENDINISFCRRERGYINQFFLRCLYTMSFWEQFRVAHNTGGSNAMTVTLNDFFFYFFVSTVILNQIAPLILIILRAKFYIYTCKIFTKNIPQLHLFKAYLKSTLDVDKN